MSIYVYKAEKRILAVDNNFFEIQSARILSREEDVIIVDFAETVIINAEGLNNLFKIQKMLEKKGKELRLRNVSPFIMEIINVTGFTKKFNVELEEGVYIAPKIIDQNNYQQIEEELLEVLKNSEFFMLIDLENTTKITFEALVIFLKIDKRATKRNIHLILHNVSESLLATISLHGFQGLFTMTFL